MVRACLPEGEPTPTSAQMLRASNSHVHTASCRAVRPAACTWDGVATPTRILCCCATTAAGTGSRRHGSTSRPLSYNACGFDEYRRASDAKPRATSLLWWAARRGPQPPHLNCGSHVQTGGARREGHTFAKHMQQRTETRSGTQKPRSKRTSAFKAPTWRTELCARLGHPLRSEARSQEKPWPTVHATLRRPNIA